MEIMKTVQTSLVVGLVFSGALFAKATQMLEKQAVKEVPKMQTTTTPAPKQHGIPMPAAGHSPLRGHMLRHDARLQAAKASTADSVVTQAHKKLDKVVHAAKEVVCQHPHGWKGRVAVGYGWTGNTGITNPDSTYWDSAKEGYDADLGKTMFFQLGVDKQINHDCQFGCSYLVGLEMNLVQNMHYQKYQTGAQTNMGGTGANRMRFFDVHHAGFLAHALVKKDWTNKFGVMSPYVEVGAGLGVNSVYNFHTVAYKADIGTNTGAGSVTSVGSDMRTTLGCAWQVGFGFEFRPADCQSVAARLGYRYYGGGKIVTPAQIMFNNDDAVAGQGRLNTVPAPWTGHIHMHQLLLGLEISF